MTISRNIWTVKGTPIGIKHYKQGVLIKLKGNAYNGKVFMSNRSKFDVWIRKEVLDSIPHGVNICKYVNAHGHLIFKEKSVLMEAECLTL